MQAVTITQITPNELTSIIEDAIRKILTNQPAPAPQLQSKYLTAHELAKYLKRPIGSIYQMQHKGIINGVKMAGSNRLYYDIDVINAAFKNSNK